MNYYTKLALSLLGVGLLAGVWYADEHYTKKEEEQKKTAGKALSFETEKVRKVTAKTDSGTLIFERKDAAAAWDFVDPKGVTKPDSDAVNNLLSALQTLSVETDLAGSEAATKAGSKEGENFGFNKPKGRFVVSLEGGKELSLTVGSEVSVGSTSGSTFNALSLYATSPSRDKVLIVGSTLSSTLKKSFSDYRSKSVGDFTIADVKGLVVKKGAEVVVDMSKNDSAWSITAPNVYNADLNNIGLYLDKVQKLRVEGVTEATALNEEMKASLGLAVPAGSITILGADKKVLQTILVGMTKEKMTLTLQDGAVGSIEIGKFSELIPETKYFRDRRVMRDVSMADAVKLTTKSGRGYHKEGEQWYFTSNADLAAKPADVKSTTTAAAAVSPTPSNAKASDKDAETVFSQWEFIVADDILDNPSGSLKEFGLDNPIQRVSFGFREGKPAPVEILVGNRVPKNEKLVYVKRGDKSEIFAVESQWLEALGRMDGQVGTSPQAQK